MMPRLDIMALRWLLLGFNILSLSALGFAGYTFFLGESNELHVRLTEPAKFALPAPDTRKFDGLARDINTNLYRKPEKKTPFVERPKTDLQEARTSGPLSDYQILTIAANEGHRTVFLGEKKAQITIRKPTSPRSRRSRASSRSSARSSRGKGRRPAISTNKGLTVGEEFKGCIIEKILEDHIIYSKGGTPYKLMKEPSESSVAEAEGGGWVLSPIADEDAVAAGQALDPADLGDIGTKGKSTVKKPGASNSRTLNTRAGKVNAKDRAKAQEMIRELKKLEAKRAAGRGNTQGSNDNRNNNNRN